MADTAWNQYIKGIGSSKNLNSNSWADFQRQYNQATDNGVTFEDFQGDTAYDTKVTPGVNPNAWGMKDIATGVNAVTGLANAFLGYKNYGLAKDTLNFNKAATNRDIANQGLAYNTELDRRAGIDARLRGGTDEIRKQVADEYAAKKMNTSAIG